jgi:serine/threonine protein phosphatase PrpC
MTSNWITESLRAALRTQMRTNGRECEDRVMARVIGDALIVAVADGAGGMGGAANAAGAVVEAVNNAALHSDNQFDANFWCDVLRSVDQRLAQSAHGGQSTAVVAAVSPSHIAGASVGDSGAWLIGVDGYDDLTAYQVRKPLIGSGCATPVIFRAGAIEGTLLIASDGLLKYARPIDVCCRATMNGLDEALSQLVALVRAPGGVLVDDIGIVLIRPNYSGPP